MARSSHRLSVYLNGRLVGTLTREASGAIQFQYDPAWLDWPHTLPVSLSLPLREDRYTGAPVADLFDNLLPDSEPIRRQIAERVGAEGVDAYSLLEALGRDCVGALQLLPAGAHPADPGHIQGDPISDAHIARILKGLARNPLGIDRDTDFRVSIAGAQEKTALLRWNDKWLRPRGSTPTTHILKPQIGQLPNGLDLSNSVENEYLCLKLAAALGLPVATAEIANFGPETVLVVQRFDRRITGDRRLLRLPQEDCCQALSVPWTKKYESEGGPGIPRILKLLAGSDEPLEDQRNFLKANFVFWLLAATDGHAKNFSLALYPGGRYRLTPLYDVVSAEPSYAVGHIRQNQMKLAMAVGKSRHYVISRMAPRHFVESAVLGGMGRKAAAAAIDEVYEAAPRALTETLAGLPRGFPTGLADAVARRVRQCLRQLPATQDGWAADQ